MLCLLSQNSVVFRLFSYLSPLLETDSITLQGTLVSDVSRVLDEVVLMLSPKSEMRCWISLYIAKKEL